VKAVLGIDENHHIALSSDLPQVEMDGI